MLKNKKLLLFSLLNSLAVTYSATESGETSKYEKLYNNMVKNMKNEKSNKENYKLIESILNKRNKELKDLYLQNDYIMKPEYLEWQIFFSGFYSNENRGGKKENIAIPIPDNSNTITLSIHMPEFDIKTPDITIGHTVVEIPKIDMRTENINPPTMNYNGTIITPEFNLPQITVPVATVGTFSVLTASLFSPRSTYDKTFYNPSLGVIQTWNAGLFSNYNLDSGNFTFSSKTTSPASLSFSFTNAVGSIDPTAIIDPTLNQPSVIPTSDTNTSPNFMSMIVSTSAPNIRVGQNVNIDFSGIGSTSSYSSLMALIPINPNRSAINADSDYAYGGTKQYPDSQASIPFSILRNSGTINMYGSYLVTGVMSRGNLQTVQRNDYLLVNDGTIIGNYNSSSDRNQVGFGFSDSVVAGGFSERYIFINDGKMEFRAPNSIAFMMSGVNIGKYQIVQNRGIINMYGANNIGVNVAYSSLSGSNPPKDQQNTKILLEAPINVQGDNSVGIFYAPLNMKAENSVFKVNIGTEKNSYSGNLSGNDPNYVEKSVGIYLRPSSDSYFTGTTITTLLKNYDFKFGDYAKNSVLILNDGSENSYYFPTSTLTTSQLVTIDNSIVSSIDIENGQNNTVIYNSGKISNTSFAYIPVLNIKPDINIGNSSKMINNTVGLYNSGGIVHLTGNINTYGDSSHAIYNSGLSYTSGVTTVKLAAQLDNTISGAAKSISLITNGNDATALHNKESIVNFSLGGTYKALGNQGTVFYNDKGTINITGDALFEAGDNGVVLYANGGLMNLNGNITYNVKNGSVFTAVNETAGVQINLSGGNQTLNLEDGGIGFLYDGNSVPLGTNSLTDFLNTYFTGLNNLNVNVSDTSRLFIIINYGTMNLSELEILNSGNGVFKSVSGNLGSSLLNKGTLVLDTVGTINLDDPDDIYSNTEKASTGITVNSGVNIIGTMNGQAALSGKDQYRGTSGGSTYVVMNNNGSINLSGDNSIGIYTDNGIINNFSEVNAIGDNSAGLFGENGSVITNTGSIKIAGNSVGIYAVSYQDPQNPNTGFGDGTINVTNNGIITVINSEKTTGIYSNNNKAGALRTSGIVNLGTGTIDVSLSKNGTGVYTENSTVSGGGIIITGENGIGLYSKNSDLNLSNITLNLNGNNSLGIYLDSGSSLNTSGTNTFNVSGHKNILFYVNADGIFNQNFLINADSSADYSVLYSTNNILNYTGTAITNGNGALLYGKNSSITFGNSGILTSTADSSIGLYADGLYNSGSSDYEGINKGIITLRNNSAGLYAINGARLSNENKISVGDYSIGVYGENSTDIQNNGNIEIGNNSIGMTAKNINNLENTGVILSHGENSIGIYSNTNSLSNIINSGNIELNNNKSIGIYLEGTGLQIFTNDTAGTIKIGDSINLATPGVGIYNNGNTINNNGNITSGVNSLGIYNINGIINHNAGNITSDTNGIGIYSTGGELNLNGGNLKSETLGIYSVNNTTVKNSGTITESGDNSTTYVLKSGSSLINNQNGSIGTDSVFVYGDGAGDVNNSGALITLTGKNSTGFYMLNSGNVYNSADITGMSTGNVGIYSNHGTITNFGNINLGDSEIIDKDDLSKNRYSIGIYGENVEIKNSGNIRIGDYGTGIYTENNKITNNGEITSNGENAVGLWGENAEIENNNQIILDGDYSQGIVGTNTSTIINNSIITLNGNNSIGITGDTGTKIYNNGTINLNGNDSTGVMLSNGASLLNKGTINLGSGMNNMETGTGSNLTPPTIINAGVIKVDGNFVLNGYNVIIQVDPSTIKAPEIGFIATNNYAAEDIKAKFLTSNEVHFIADSFDFSKPVLIDPLFTQGTNALVYKFENVFEAKDMGSASSIKVDSNSLTFRATPSINNNGNMDIWMEKVPYQDFTKGTWYDGLAKSLDASYVRDDILEGQTQEALNLYDKIDMITDVDTLKKTFENISGEMYSNTLQRENDIAGVFNNALDVLKDSENNTKENVKINIIAGKGNSKENTDGVMSYDYNTMGVLALREIERTYRHTFGYSAGYLRTDFQFDDTNSEDTADTIQLGLHNKYSVDNWNFKSDLLGRLSFHNVDREVEWNGWNNSNLNAEYMAYGVTLLNEVTKDLEAGKNFKIKPYAGLELGYMFHTDFEESGGSERLKVKENDDYSVKPNAGIRFEVMKDFGANSDWTTKMSLDFGYEYELGEMNNQETVSLTALGNDNYYNLAKPAEDKGRFKVRGLAGIDLKERYGVYITGEYGKGEKSQSDYKLGLSLKAEF